MTAMLAKAADTPIYYGPALCAYPQFECIKTGRGDTWERLFPDENQRDLVQRLNRSYNHLWPGKEIVVPKNLSQITLFDISPFPLKINPEEKEKQIIVDQEKLAWGAYDEQGNLVKWGPISSGSDRCSDNSSPTCRTMTGIFRVFSKENEKCKSDVFPLGKGGAKMPYCMYFHKGLALHGSDDIPGYRASHGCIRMFVQDAKWLNLNFVQLSNERNNFLGTKVVIRPLIAVEKKQVTGKKQATEKIQ
ncbi:MULTISPECIES: L,D-transpeptidase [Legionella]|uniref:Murein L,D-transpeptidase n=1 Tax=Legionella septentrionalis TaxID=2498109 RepID=A0A3S0X1V5_9GAMM|nr:MULTISPECIES: L,D-transpeptidase [Legionella]MCP0914094.1 L,D-transpeptidase [Legionella sp. 27cVA30]RUQ90811.1 murein L,D-transpeptidase [Legionella septentrionalis]RUQ99977.1 murein L,D-transpeptidase [Legionella septentrionalis]RUR10241.1 murein L,D-transpeptidase [Legionella septentrionalis]RUR15811.1 murein L,D-transpeptidase [Legionella septentrionalis]